ncbi:MAG: CCA tRNA nucleotidyltransferase [Verrucomicrobiota bacterium]
MPSAREKATRLVKSLSDKGYQAYFAGGCVRDVLLNKTPKDFDIATDAVPEQVQACFPHSKSVGAHFGVILVHLEDDDFEIATFRAEGNYTDGRHPGEITFTTAEEDAQRRDFTINGIFYDPIADNYIDYVDGQSDLKNNIIRAIGNPDERFAEDHLRLLRAIRFAATLDYKIEPATWSALKEHADKITLISEERIRDELSRIFTDPNRVRGFDLLVESGLMNILLPEIIALQGCDQPPQFHPEGDVFVHTRLMLSHLPEEASLPLVLSVLLHDIGKPETRTYDKAADRIRFNAHDRVGARMTEKILRRLKYSNETIDTVAEAVASHMIFKDVQKMRVAKLKRFMARPGFDDELELHRVDCLGSHGMLDNLDFLREKREEFANEPLIPPPLVTGHDLIKLGWKPGPDIGHILEEVQTRQLEGALNTHEEAIAWINDNFSAPSSNT